MKTFYYLFTALFCAMLSINTIAQNTESEFIEGRILVMLESGQEASSIAKTFEQYGMHLVKEVSSPMRIWAIEFDPNLINHYEMLYAVKDHPAVQLAQNDHYIQDRATVPNDPNFANQWHHVNPNDADIDSDLAWDITTGGLSAHGDTIVVCIIENADLPHPDLQDNAWYNYNEIPNNGIDDDLNGYVDDFEGWNPGGNNDNVYGGSHGTQVAGMIGAKGDNNLGVAGANWDVKMMVVTRDGISESAVIESYTYPLVMRRLYNQTDGANGAFVVSTNASWGIDGGQPSNAPLWCAFYDTLGTAGVLNCGATANNAVDVDVVGDLPTACPSDFMVSVTATDNSDQRTFSAWGLTTIDVGAPGASVWTTTMGGGYGSASGTSFASPLTAGVIGLLYSVPCASLMDLVKSDPEAGALYIRDALFNGVDQVGNLPGATVTGGRINSFNSIMEILNNCGACPEAYNLIAVWASMSDIQVTWDALSTGPYNVRYRSVGDSIWTTESGIPATTYLITGVTPCKAYEVQVEVFCDSIFSGFSQSVIIPSPVEPIPMVTLDNDEVICDGDMVMLTSSADSSIWSTGDTTQSIIVTSTGSYFVTGVGFCNSENSDTTDILVLPYPAQPISSDEILTNPGIATLSATGDSVLWYDVAVGGQAIGTGNSWDTPFLNLTTDFWCSDANGFGGPPIFDGNPAQTTVGQYHAFSNNWSTFEAYEPFTILSVFVYANGAGNRTIGLIDMSNNSTVQQATINIPDGDGRIQLDFEVPALGEYGLRVMNGDPQLWRDGQGSNPAYPFSLGGLGSITGATSSSAFYYFFYDWEVQEESTLCESPRTQVTVTVSGVGIEEQGLLGQINVYPSPANNEVNFDLSNVEDRSDLVINVLDMNGRLVVSKIVVDLKESISTSSLADGLYHFNIERNSSVLGSGRFTVAH